MPTDVVKHDARAVVAFAKAREPLARIIAGESLSLDDLVLLGRLNSFCVAQWYEPMITMLPEAQIEAGVADFLRPLVA